MKQLYKPFTLTVAMLLLPCLVLFGQAPTVTITGDYDLTYYEPNKDYVINIEISGNSPDETLMLNLGYTSDISEEDYEVTPGLPYTGVGSISAQLKLRFTDRYQSYKDLYFVVNNANGDASEIYFNFLVSEPLELYAPTDPIIICINEPFSISVWGANSAEAYYTAWVGYYGNTQGPFGEDVSGDVTGLYATREEDFAREEDIGTYQLEMGAFDYDLNDGASAGITIKVVDCSKETWAWDVDEDSYGGALTNNYYLFDSNDYTSIVNNNSDCNDQNAAIHPEAEELVGDGIDNNCNGEVDEAEVCWAQHVLKLKANCSDGASVRSWQIYNPNTCPVAVEWWVHKANEKGSITAVPGYSTFTTTAVNKNDVVFISWTDADGESVKKGMTSSSANCKVGKGTHARTASVGSTGVESLTAYPVPFNNSLNLSYQGISHSSSIQVLLVAVDGRQYDLTSKIIRKSDGIIALDLKGVALVDGIYAVQLKIDEQSPVFIRIVKQQQ